MGTLVHLASGRHVPLRAIHVVGRAPSSDLALPSREVSAQHAALRWSGERWTIRDLGSRNGTWVDGTRVPAGEEVSIQGESGLGFGSPGVTFRLVDSGPPEAAAFPLDGGSPVLLEDGLIFLPDAEAPVACLHQDTHGAWVADLFGERQVMRDGDILDAGGVLWRLHLPEPLHVTETSPSAQVHIGRIGLRFEVSWDEENVNLYLSTPAGEHDLGGRSHNYLLLTLARQRLADAADPHLPVAEQGWIYADELTRMLGIDANVIYLHTCRARKQLAKFEVANSVDLVERRPGSGQLRIGVTHLEIVTDGGGATG